MPWPGHSRPGRTAACTSIPADRFEPAPSARPAVDVRVAPLEAESLVEAVGSLARRARCELDGPGAGLGGDAAGLDRERLAGAFAPRRLVDHDVFDPRPQRG